MITESSATIRIDKLLWFLRICKSRTMAQKLAEAGHIRVNGQRVEKAHHMVRLADRLTLPYGAGVRAIEIIALPARRGPAPEAQSCYRELSAAQE